MSNDSLRGFLLTLNQEQEAKQRKELREQEAKRIEGEHWAETRKLKEEQFLIAAPPGWIKEESVADDGNKINLDVVVCVSNQNNIEPKKSKLLKQQEAILEAIKSNGFDPMKIPDGKKTGVIQRYCENTHASIFNGSTSFDRAWDSGVCKLWQMEYHDSYARRGNN